MSKRHRIRGEKIKRTNRKWLVLALAVLLAIPGAAFAQEEAEELLETGEMSDNGDIVPGLDEEVLLEENAFLLTGDAENLSEEPSLENDLLSIEDPVSENGLLPIENPFSESGSLLIEDLVSEDASPELEEEGAEELADGSVLYEGDILFFCAASGPKTTAEIGSGEFGEFQSRSEDGMKLTIQDDSRTGFAAGIAGSDGTLGTEATTYAGGTLDIAYSGAVTGEKQYVSALIQTEGATPKYYASLTPASSGAGTWTMKIPKGIEEGTYLLRIFSEQQSGDRLTDYAGNIVTITLTVENTPAEVAVSATGIDGVDGILLFTLTADNDDPVQKMFREGSDPKTFDTIVGQSIEFSAGELYGCTFINWTENGKVISTDRTLKWTMGENRNLVANYLQNQVVVQVDLQDREWKAGDSFEFTLTPVGSAPSLPIWDSTVTVTNTSAGHTGAFGRLVFTGSDVGKTYTYTVSQTKGSIEGITYDTSIKTVTYTVTENGGTIGLSPSPVQTVTFTNVYEPDAVAPVIKKQPADLNLTYGYTSGNVLSVEVEELEGHTYSYQWYAGIPGDLIILTSITGETGSSFTIPTGDPAGISRCYCCSVTAVRGRKTASTTSRTALVTVGKKPITVTADAKSRTCTQPDPKFTYTVTGLLDGEQDRLTGGLIREAGEDAGEYNITQGTLNAGSNYTISYTGAKLTISHASPETLITKATLDKDGSIVQRCADCGKEISRSVIPKASQIRLSASSFTYNGKARKPAVTVTASDGTALPEEAYTVTYSDNVNAGTATATVTLQGKYYTGTKSLTFTIKKAANPIKVKTKKQILEAGKLRGKAQRITAKKAFSVTKAKGNVTYKKLSGNKKITVSETGRITALKGLKKGSYTVKVKVTAAGNVNYKKKSKTVSLKIIVKETTAEVWKTVANLKSGYLAVRTAPAAQYDNEINHTGLFNGDRVKVTGRYVQGTTFGGKKVTYVWVYAPKYGISGYVNADYLK